MEKKNWQERVMARTWEEWRTEDIERAVAFLAETKDGWLNGQQIIANGGGGI